MPHPKERRLLLSHADEPGYTGSYEDYTARGGYRTLQASVRRKPAEIKKEVLDANIRGRGGALFPAGRKWGFLDPNSDKPVYLICNADESEPGTFKDRQLIHKDPHQLIEGMMISAYAIGAKIAFIYIRGEMFGGARILEEAIEKARENNLVGENILGCGYSCDLIVHRGAGFLYLRGGDRPHRVPRGQAPVSPAEAPLLPGGEGALHVPDHREQRGNPLPGKACRGTGRAGVRENRGAQLHRYPDLVSLRPREESRLL